MTKAFILLGVLQKYAPTNRAQYLASKWYNDLREKIMNDATTESLKHKNKDVIINFRFADAEFEIEKTLINALADGVNHGNWPWTNAKIN